VTNTNSTIIILTRILLTVTFIRLGLIINIKGGVLSQENNIRLGDVIVSKLSGTSKGVSSITFITCVLAEIS
jgi:hypothetical protein